MKFQNEKFSAQLVEDLIPLLALHSAEVNPEVDFKFSPNYKTYETLMGNGAVKVFSVRDTDNNMVGYCTFFISESLHFPGVKQAQQDGLFLLKEYRGTEIGSCFVVWCDDALQADGVKIVYRSVTIAVDYSKMLERVGYRHVETAFSRRLD